MPVFLHFPKKLSIFAATFQIITTMDTPTMKKVIADYFKTQPVLKAWVFGSYARGEQGPNSDIDILVRFDRERAKVGLLKYTAIILDLEKILNREVDLVEEGALLPWAEKTVNRDKQLIYERTIA